MNGIELRQARLAQYTYYAPDRFFSRLRGFALSTSSAVVPGWLGFDASAWQETIDFAAAQAAGLKWVYLRALYGLIPDTKFPTHYPAAKGIIPRTAYLYYKDANEPKIQAQTLYETCLQNGGVGDFMPVLDLENINNPVLTASKVKTCLEELELQFGVKPLIYSGYYVITNDLDGDKSFLSDYSLIIAAYPFVNWTPDLPTKVLNYPPLIPWPFVMWSEDENEALTGKVVAWQFCANAPAGEFGVSGNNLDLDWCSPAFAKQVLTPQAPPASEVSISLESKFTATHTVQPPNGILLFESAINDGWNISLSHGDYVRVLSTPVTNGRVRVRLIHKSAGMCFGWVSPNSLTELENPVTVRAVYPTGADFDPAELQAEIDALDGRVTVLENAPPVVPPPSPGVLNLTVNPGVVKENLKIFKERDNACSPDPGKPVMTNPAEVGNRIQVDAGDNLAGVAGHTESCKDTGDGKVTATGGTQYYKVTHMNGVTLPATPAPGYTGWFMQADLVTVTT